MKETAGRDEDFQRQREKAGAGGGRERTERKRTETERDREWQIYCYKERRTEDEVKPNRSSTASHLSRQINQSP